MTTDLPFPKSLPDFQRLFPDDTIFGLREDRAVLQGRCRVY
jgi:hypothetical protein